MIMTSGFIIMAGFFLLLIKLPLRTSLWLLGQGLWVDLLITILAYCLHWGTFTGVMAAAFAGVLCSLTTSGTRWMVGYIKHGRYHTGRWWNLGPKLEH
jgi:hypothetical protein